MLERTIVRLRGEELLWYPPGVEEGPQRLDSAEAKRALQQLAAAPRARLCFAVPGTDVTLLKVSFSAAEKKHIGKSLPYMLEEQLVSDIETLHIASEMVDKSHLCAAVCSVEKMQYWQQCLADLPAVQSAIPEPQLLPWQRGEWTVLIEEDYAIVRLGECEGFSVEKNMLSAMLVAAADVPEPPARVIVYGRDQARELQLLPDSLRDAVQWRRGDLRSALLLHDGGGTVVNLLQGAFAHRLPLNRWWLQWRLVAAVFAAAFCLQLAAQYGGYLRLEQENLSLRREIESSARKVIPRGALQKPEVQVRRKLDALRGTAHSSGFVSLLSRVGEILASKPATGIASINYNDRGGEMRMNITAPDFEAVEAIRNAMTKSGLQAVMESSSVQGDIVRARLRVGAGS